MATLTNTTPGGTPAVIDLTRPLPGRRNVLGDAIAGLAGAVVLAGAGITMATPETLSVADASTPAAPDAKLITLCEAFDDHEREYELAVRGVETFEQQEAIEPELKRISTLQEPLVERIIVTRATSPDGIRAKAQSIVLAGGIGGLDSSYANERLLASLLSDLLGFQVRNDQQAVRELHRRLGWSAA